MKPKTFKSLEDELFSTNIEQLEDEKDMQRFYYTFSEYLKRNGFSEEIRKNHQETAKRNITLMVYSSKINLVERWEKLFPDIRKY